MHEYSMYWTFNDEAHWRDCLENDGAYTEKAPHEWSDGIVTQEPDEVTTGIRVYTCKVCGKERTEYFAFDPSNGPTTTVTEEQMRSAFSDSRFDNVTMTYYATKSGVFSTKRVYLFTDEGTYWYQLDEDDKVIFEQYNIETENGYDVYLKGDDGKWYYESMSVEHFDAIYQDFGKRFSRQYVIFANNYDILKYNDAYKQYELITEKVSGAAMSYAILRFEAKRLIYLSFLQPRGESLDFSSQYYGEYQEFTFDNVGTTEFKKPEGAIPLLPAT